MAVATPTTIAVTLALVVVVAVAAAAAQRVAEWTTWRRRQRLPPAPAPRGGAPPLVGYSHLCLSLSEAESAEALAGAGDCGLVTTSLGPLTVVSALSASAVWWVLALDGTGATGWWLPPQWCGAFGTLLALLYGRLGARTRPRDGVTVPFGRCCRRAGAVARAAGGGAAQRVMRGGRCLLCLPKMQDDGVAPAH